MDVHAVPARGQALLDDELRTGAHEVLITRIREVPTAWMVTYLLESSTPAVMDVAEAAASATPAPR